jgi:CheY-like chemotaxis protein
VLNGKLKPVLLVEDDTVDAMTVKRALKELKVKNELVHTTDGKKALEYLSSPGNAMPCVILLDLNMPEMNGIEFLQAIKADSKLKEIPVVMLAASSEEKNIVETFHLGVAGYIFKPVDAKKLDEFKPIKLYWTIDQRRILTCLFLLMYLIMANSCYNLWVGKTDAPAWKLFMADVIPQLWTPKEVTASRAGTVVGILYGKREPCALINIELVREGDIRNGVKIVRITKDEVEFEKDGQKWTQKVLADPNPAWKTSNSITG